MISGCHTDENVRSSRLRSLLTPAVPPASSISSSGSGNSYGLTSFSNSRGSYDIQQNGNIASFSFTSSSAAASDPMLVENSRPLFNF